MEAADRVPVVHGVEGRDLVHAHRGHLQHTCHLIHDANACKAVLPLSEVEDGHDGGFLVLRGVSAENLLDELIVLWRKLKGDRGIIDGRVAMLHARSATQWGVGGEVVLTTLRESLRGAAVAPNARH